MEPLEDSPLRRRPIRSLGQGRPDKAGELAGDGGHDVLFRLPASREALIAAVQPLLRRPGSGDGRVRCAILAPAQGVADKQMVAVMPRRFDEHTPRVWSRRSAQTAPARQRPWWQPRCRSAAQLRRPHQCRGPPHLRIIERLRRGVAEGPPLRRRRPGKARWRSISPPASDLLAARTLSSCRHVEPAILPLAALSPGPTFFRRRNKTMRRQFMALVALAVAGLVAPAPAQAQTYKMEKVDIKGEGGTDYVAVDAATGRVFVSRCDAHDGRRRRDRQGARRHSEYARRARRGDRRPKRATGSRPTAGTRRSRCSI